MNISLSPFTPENLVSRDGFGSPVPRKSAHLHAQAESGAYSWNSFRVPRRRPYINFKPPYAIGLVSSLSGHANAYRWRSLPRARRNRASRLQVSSKRVLPWQFTIDQLICASLSHTRYWYEVGMLKYVIERLYCVGSTVSFSAPPLIAPLTVLPSFSAPAAVSARWDFSWVIVIMGGRGGGNCSLGERGTSRERGHCSKTLPSMQGILDRRRDRARRAHGTFQPIEWRAQLADRQTPSNQASVFCQTCGESSRFFSFIFCK